LNSSVSLVLVTFRDLFQSLHKADNPLGRKYQDSSAVVRLSEKDFCDLGLEEGGNVRITNGNDEVIVVAKMDEGISSGFAYIPKGPYANRVIVYDPDAGWPNFKHTNIICLPTDDEVLSLAGLYEEMKEG